MTYSLHPGAEHDIANALDFYKEQAGLVVAERFLEEFERVAKLLVVYPDLGTPTTRGRRTFPLKVFPYSVVYRNLGSSIRILIVRHQHRKPGYAGGRR
ncbi:MAG: type II toxin-antitoxin system RelE/ParE family toxin [Nitrosomonadales bacterium]|nr:type II toxin-antitoxin system RelE/ParE family toxin [Nitrosomonadales bacterium]